MKRKLVMFLVVTLSAGILLTGCQKKVEEKKDVVTKVEKEEKKEENKKQEEFKCIGIEDAESSKILLQNATGKDIVGVAIKKSEDGEFPESMLLKGDVYLPEEKRYFFFKFDNVVENTESDDKLLTQGYDVQITLSDGLVYVLHGFPYEDMQEGSIELEDDVAFLKYVSASTKMEQNTKETEVALKEQKLAEEAAEKDKSEQQSTQPKPTVPQKQSKPTVVPQQQATPQQQVTPETTPQQPSESQPSTGEGCLDNGLFY